MNQAPQMKPQLSFFKEIDSLHSMQNFSTKNYKLLSKLKVVKQSPQDNKRIQFQKISIKSIKHLDLTSFNVQNLETPHLKFIIKRFSKIRQFSSPLPCNDSDVTNQSLLPALILLKKAKYLTNLSLQASFNRLPERFLSWLKLCKIKALDLTHIPLDWYGPELSIFIDLSEYLPSTIENLSLLTGKRIQKTVCFKHSLNVKHIKNLQKLELGMRLTADTFKDLVKTIHDPLKLKSLRFDVIQGTKEDFESIEIEKFLKKCCNLERLSVWRLKVSSETMKRMQLNELVLSQTLYTKEDILRVEYLLQPQQNSLKNLDLHLLIHRDLGTAGLFDSLFERLKLMKGLRKIKLNFRKPLSSKSIQICSLISQLIEAIDCLEEIDIEGTPSGFKNEEMCKALQKHSQSLRSLRVSLDYCSVSDLLIVTLKGLSRLERLSLKNLTIEDSKLYLDLRDIVCEINGGLNSVRLMEVKRPNKKAIAENVTKMLKDIICKPMMSNFCYTEHWDLFTSPDFEGVRLNLFDVAKQSSHFKHLDFPSEACMPYYDSNRLGLHKWGDS